MKSDEEDILEFPYTGNSNGGSLMNSLTDSFENCNNQIKIPRNKSYEDFLISSTPPNPINYLSERTREKWVENNSKCQGCSTTFRIYRRCHHCRICGSSFCDNCTSHREKIPRVIKKIPTRTGREEPINYDIPVRLCEKCFEKCDSIHKLEKLLTVFSLLELDIFDFKNLSMVCRAWRPMALFYLSKFRDIQYKLPIYPYNSWEKQALWSNRFILANHSIWEIHVLRSLKDDKKKLYEAISLYTSRSSWGKNSKECWDRMCNRFCKRELDPDRSLLLLDLLDNSKEMRVLILKIISTFETCEDYMLECYLPFILFKCFKISLVKEFIFKRCITSIRIASSTYWYIKNNQKKYLNEFISKLPKDFISKILKEETFVEICREGDLQDPNLSIISPVTPELGEQNIKFEDIVIKKSATMPTFIPCSKSKVLFKKDDIRKDYIIICVIRLMEKILQENGLDVSIITYNVQPVSSTEGFVQIVEDAETLYSISEKMKTTLINFLMSHNPNESVYNLRKRFQNSCAVYSVIAFLLSISDRNTENLMLTQKGDLFHIDFGFVLSLDPKAIRASCIRITEQMVDALGGAKSNEFEEFKELCAVIYDILRKHVNTFVCLLSLIPTFKSESRTSPTLGEEEMYTEIIKRFAPGETYEEAIKNMKTRIENSADHSTLTKYHVIDFFHKLNKEETMSSYLSSAYHGTKALMNGVYSYIPFTGK